MVNMRDCIYITECSGCTIIVNPKKCSKVVIDKCANSSILLETTLVSAVTEIIGCENCNISFKKMDKDETYLTLQCDRTTDTNLKFIPCEKQMYGITILSDPKSLKNSV